MTKILAVLLLSSLSLGATEELQHELYMTSEVYRESTGPLFVTHSPNNEANPRVLPDGEIQMYYSGERSGPVTMEIHSKDNGLSWSTPRLVFEDDQTWQYPRRTLVDQDGTLHMLLFESETLAVLHTISTDRGLTWSKKNLVAKGRIGAIRAFIQCKSGRLVFAFHRRLREKKGNHPLGSSSTTSCYSDDGGQTWVESKSWISSPCFEGSGVNNYGAVEPNIIELNDGRLWLLVRTQTGKLYESYSSDEGETWSEGKPSVFHSSSSPPNLFRLPGGRMVLCWSNTSQPELDVFGRIYVNREALHLAISDDDGKTWRGFREVFLNPLRNGGPNDFSAKGDKGTSYPTMDFTQAGEIVLATGQGEDERFRAVFLIDPAWLYETSQREDFSGDMRHLSAYSFLPGRNQIHRHRFLGPRIIAHPQDDKQSVMHLRHFNANYASNTAVWNFPMARKGSVQLEVRKNIGAAPLELALTDHHAHPDDPGARQAAMIRFDVGKTLNLKDEQWAEIRIQWDLDRGICEVFHQGKSFAVALQNATETGISYLRLNLLADAVDTAGWYINTISSETIEPRSFSR